MLLDNTHSLHAADAEQPYRNVALLEKYLDKLLSPYNSFVRNQVTTSSIVFICIVLALILANSPLASYYENFINLKLGLHFGAKIFTANLQHWINDGLLALFFFVIGLEIKQQLLVGILKSKRRSLVIVAAALGGMLCPALIFYLLNHNGPAAHAWGIPIATDTAFALGILMLLKKRIPHELFAFLTALAIIDDVVAVMVIAVFYTQDLNTLYLLAAGVIFAVLVFLNLLGVHKPLPYLALGILLWLAILWSGVHATVAGILLALTIPARSKTGPHGFRRQVRKLLRRFESKQLATQNIELVDANQHLMVNELQKLAKLATTPLQRWKAFFDKPVVLMVLPLFAFINVGIPCNLQLFTLSLQHPISLGISLGLIFGKALGIFTAGWCSVKLLGGVLPPQVNFHHLAATSILCGIGFTMSMFIANLSFEPASVELILAKTGILTASCIAGVVGYIWLRLVSQLECSQQ
jgi:NhaA family Na+:H+ antiporter